MGCPRASLTGRVSPALRAGLSCVVGQIDVKGLRERERTPSLAECRDPHHAHPAVKRDRYYVIDPNWMRGRNRAASVDANVTLGSKLSGGRSGSHQACMPQPLIDALPGLGRRDVLSAGFWCWPQAVPSEPAVWRTVNWDREVSRAARCGTAALLANPARDRADCRAPSVRPGP